MPVGSSGLTHRFESSGRNCLHCLFRATWGGGFVVSESASAHEGRVFPTVSLPWKRGGGQEMLPLFPRNPVTIPYVLHRPVYESPPSLLVLLRVLSAVLAPSPPPRVTDHTSPHRGGGGGGHKTSMRGQTCRIHVIRARLSGLSSQEELNEHIGTWEPATTGGTMSKWANPLL